MQDIKKRLDKKIKIFVLQNYHYKKKEKKKKMKKMDAIWINL